MSGQGQESIWRLVARGMTPPAPGRPQNPAGGAPLVGRHDTRPFEGESPLPALSRLAHYDPEGDRHDRDWVDPFKDLLNWFDRDAQPAPEPAAEPQDEEQTPGTDEAATPDRAETDPQPPDGSDAPGGESVAGPGDRDAASSSSKPFRTVTPGSLAAYPRIHVYVHGWVPGSRETMEALFVQQGEVARAWDGRVANTTGTSLLEAYVPLLDALHRADGEAAVLWYSWVDQSGTDTGMFSARGSLAHTEINGRRLAMALQEAIGDGSPEVHLIGHSHGSVVATAAALTMSERVPHLTIMDCPEDWFSRAGGAAGMLGHVLPRLQPGRGQGRTFVDSYASMFGRSYHADPGLSDVVDVRLTPSVTFGGPPSPVSQAHQYPVVWYAESALDRDVPSGLSWSPLVGFDTTELGSAYHSARGTSVVETAPRADGSVEDDVVVEPLTVDPVELTRGSPDAAFVVPLPPDALLLEFDYTVNRAARRTRLEVAVDRQLAFTARAKQPVPARGRYLRLPQEQQVTVQFRLVDPGLRTSITLTGLRLVRSTGITRNLDDSGAAATIAAFGAGVGAAATLSVVGLVWGVRRLVRRSNGC